MKRLNSSLLLLSATAALTAQAASIEDLLPADTSVVIRVDNANDISGKMEKHPLAALAENEAIRAFFAPLADKFSEMDADESFEDAAGMTVEEALDLFEGPMVAGMSLTKMVDAANAGDDIEGAKPDIVAAVRYKNKAALQKLLESEAFMGNEEKSVRTEESTFMGETLTSVVDDTEEGEEEETVHFALVKDTFIISPSLAALQDAVVRLKDSSASGFGSTALAQRMKTDYASSEIVFYADLNPMMSILESGIRSGMAPKDGQPPNPMLPTADAVIAALDLHSISSVLLAGDIQEEVIRLKADIGIDFDRGIGTLFDAYSTGYPTPDFVPADVASVDTASFDVGKAFEALEQIVAKASPMLLAIYQGQLQQMKQGTGVDLRADLIGGLGSGIVAYNLEMPEQAGEEPVQPMATVVAFKLDDPVAFERALQTILSMTPAGPMIEQRDYMGTTLRVIPGPTGEPTGVLAINGGWLIFSNQLFAVQGALSASGSGKAIWGSAAIADGSTRLKSGGVGMSYASLAPLMKIFMQAFAQGMADAAANDEETDDMPQPNMDAIGDLGDLPFHVLSRSHKDDEGLHSESVIYKFEE